jgi:hypothetical protein
MPKIGFEATEMKLNFIYKTLFPGSWRRRFLIEDKIIPFLPYAPSNNHKKIHEARDVELSFLLYKYLENTTLDRPLDANHKPSGGGRGTLKEHMHHGFINIIMAKWTKVTFNFIE